MTPLRPIALAALLIAGLALAACGGSSSSPTTATQTVTETQTQTQQATETQSTEGGGSTQGEATTVYTEGRTDINVATGDAFTIQLPINPSTGYTWVPNVPMGYVQVSDEILKPAQDGNMVGQGSTEQWVFSADTPGTGTITFDLTPPGSGAKAEKTVTFTVNAS
ncbi:MAG: protease inhibitor I42 family protein [Gaiellales bacterium]